MKPYTLILLLFLGCSKLSAPIGELRFNTPEEAANHATNRMILLYESTLKKREYVCVIFFDGKQYGYTDFATGTDRNAVIPVKSVPKGCFYYSSLHNHPSVMYSEIPSWSDLVTTTMVVSPDGSVVNKIYGNGSWSFLYSVPTKHKIKYRLKPGRHILDVDAMAKEYIDYETGSY